MRFHYAGKYNGKEESLPFNEHRLGYVPFKEPDQKAFAILANAGALGMYILTIGIYFLRARAMLHFGGILLSFVCLVPHEFLHALCFKEDVYMYTYLSKGMLFVVGPEDMSKKRFIGMSLCPNIVFGLIPFVLFLLHPQWILLGTFGAFSIPMGFGDYINVFNAATQMPANAKTYLHGFHSYWYIPKENEK